GNDGIVMTYAPMTIGTAITGIDSVTYGGTSTLTLAPPTSGSTYAGTTTINSGKLVLGTNNAPFGDPTKPVVFNGGAFTANPCLPTPVATPTPVLFNQAGVNFLPQPGLSLAFNGPVTLSGNNQLAVPQNVTLTFNGQVSDGPKAPDPNSVTVMPSAVSAG